MSDDGSTSVKAVIMETLRGKFGSLTFWLMIEPDIAMFCADLPEPTNDKKKVELVKHLKLIKQYLRGHDITKEDLKFFDEEIDRYENTKEISLFEESDDEVQPEIIEKYARLGAGTEGVVGIHHPLNYRQVCKLTNGVFDKTGLIKFYISREITLYGKIVAEIYEHPQKIPIARLVESKRTSKETGEPLIKKVALFGEPVVKTQYNTVREIPIPFFVYRFITEDNKEMILMTTIKCDIGDYIITGMMTECDDYRMLTESARLPTKLPFFFAQILRNRIIKFKSHDEFVNKTYQLKIRHKDYFDYPFTTENSGVYYKLLQPEWYKKLIWAWLLHQSKGLFNNYPMHLMILGPKGTGKSLLLNSLHSKSKETRDIFSGSSSTLKYLIPSFKTKPAQLGYLAESNRYAFCDEFLRCIVRAQMSESGKKEENVALMNDLLEHQKREAGSGISKVKVNMTARIIAPTNKIAGIKNVQDLIKYFDESFLSRWIIYDQTPEHVQMIRNSNDYDLEIYDHKIPLHDWIAMLDYLHSFSSEYDMSKVLDVFESGRLLLTETLNRHYDARHKHHIECLIDGIVKTRCFLTGSTSYKASPKDYEDLKTVWSMLISSWVDFTQVRNMDISDRINYMPEKVQLYFSRYSRFKKRIKVSDAKEIALKIMTAKEFYNTWAILKDNDLISEWEGISRPWFVKSSAEVENDIHRESEDAE